MGNMFTNWKVEYKVDKEEIVSLNKDNPIITYVSKYRNHGQNSRTTGTELTCQKNKLSSRDTINLITDQIEITDINGNVLLDTTIKKLKEQLKSACKAIAQEGQVSMKNKDTQVLFSTKSVTIFFCFAMFYEITPIDQWQKNYKVKVSVFYFSVDSISIPCQITMKPYWVSNGKFLTAGEIKKMNSSSAQKKEQNNWTQPFPMSKEKYEFDLVQIIEKNPPGSKGIQDERFIKQHCLNPHLQLEVLKWCDTNYDYDVTDKISFEIQNKMNQSTTSFDH